LKSILILLILTATALGDGRFYRLYWAEFSHEISNHRDGRWRVNDPQLSLHEDFGRREESRANGLVLLNAPEDLFSLEKAVLYLEMWGGHPHTADKRVTVNGKASYAVPDFGVSTGHCVYAYPEIEIEPAHLVNGINALQFSCDRGHGFWGHFIMDNVALKCVLRQDSLFAQQKKYTDFSARVLAPACIENESVEISLSLPRVELNNIAHVDFFAHYTGFDENGNGLNEDWHGYTHRREFVHHAGRAEKPPFRIIWNTDMIPDQSRPMAFKAVIQFADGLFYETDPTPGTLLIRDRETVQMFYGYEAPVPFWSRDGNLKTGKIFLPVDMKKILKAQLQVKIWDGGEGDVKAPFAINNHPYNITSQKAIHDAVHTVQMIDPHHLTSGDNLITLLSDTEHHGIEVLLPGPCLILRMKR